ncbi:hypothetical protein T265_06865 [Opisthorchis viverrini]|uniref:Uncharacterized protein n=1 Tax=Opisthorchis viverrini TaxID=6198 RepID=A0A074ZR00_OPIVI|nr:hypothetical protein T265_06865 [Opisthorchis viverrini]KER25765.1 hypothetical protein T265_06865 [Opisthorchis viverrini]
MRRPGAVHSVACEHHKREIHLGSSGTRDARFSIRTSLIVCDFGSSWFPIRYIFSGYPTASRGNRYLQEKNPVKDAIEGLSRRDDWKCGVCGLEAVSCPSERIARNSEKTDVVNFTTKAPPDAAACI